MNPIILIGYSGHAYVINEIFQSQQQLVVGYCDNEEKQLNPFNLKYFGTETSENALNAFKKHDWFVAIGANRVRRGIFEKLFELGLRKPINAIHKHSIVSNTSTIGYGVMISSGVVINALAKIGNGVVCNTNCTIEHECNIEDFVHIAPGAVLCGNVSIGEDSFIGANAILRQGITIGKNVIVGAGAVILNDIPANCTVFGNPAKIKTT